MDKFNLLIDKVSKKLRPMSEVDKADASVCLLLKRVNNEVEALFVKRVENPTDPWSGQMALPGGKRDQRDLNLQQTVIRETLEETGINLLDCSRLLGALEPLRSTQKPEMKILSFIFLLEREPSIVLNEELERFVWIPIHKLRQSKGFFKTDWGNLPAYIVGNDIIWGLTYRILEKFMETVGE